MAQPSLETLISTNFETSFVDNTLTLVPNSAESFANVGQGLIEGGHINLQETCKAYVQETLPSLTSKIFNTISSRFTAFFSDEGSLGTKTISVITEANDKIYDIGREVLPKLEEWNIPYSSANPEAIFTVIGYALLYQGLKSKKWTLVGAGGFTALFGIGNIILKPEKTVVDGLALVSPLIVKTGKLTWSLINQCRKGESSINHFTKKLFSKKS